MRVSPRTPLFRPDRYFATHEINFFRVMVLVGLLVIAGPVTVYGVGWILVNHIDGTVMVDNPDRPPDFVCDDGFHSDMYDEGACDRSKEIEQNVDRVLWSAIDGLVGPALVAFPIILLIIGMLLHVGSWLADGSGGIFPSFAVAAWGLLPSVLSIVVMLPLLWVAVDSYTLLPNQELSTVIDPLMGQIENLEQVTIVVSMLTAVWGGIIWRYGLEHHRNIPAASARITAGTTALIVVLLGLLS